MQFCKDCNNLLYPRAEHGILQYVCQRCETVAEPVTPIVSLQGFKKKHSNVLTTRRNLLQDPTLPRYHMQCRSCGHTESVGYMEASEEKVLNSYYVCTKCFYEWSDD